MSEKELFSVKQLQFLIIPLILEQILGVTVGLADSIMVSSAGEAAMSGVALVDAINILLVNTFAALATGGAVVAAHRLGEKKEKEAVKTANQLLFIVVGVALVIMLMALVGNRFILRIVYRNLETDVMEKAVIYFYIIALSFPFLGIYNSCAALCRAMGNSKVTMLVSLVMNIINIAGNAVMIYGLKTGVFGAAVSTLLARIVGASIMLAVLVDKQKPIHFDRTEWQGVSRKVIRKICQVGMPIGLDGFIFQIGKILVQGIVAGLGTAAISANSIVGMVGGIATIPASAVGMSMVTVVGQTIGAGRPEEAKRYVRKLIMAAYMGMAIVNVPLFFFAGKVVGLYSVSQYTAQIATEVIIFHSVIAVTLWPLSFALPNAIRATYDATFTMVVSVSSMWIFRIGFSYLFCKIWDMGVMGVWMSMGIDWLFRSIMFVWRVKSGKWLKKVGMA